MLNSELHKYEKLKPKNAPKKYIYLNFYERVEKKENKYDFSRIPEAIINADKPKTQQNTNITPEAIEAKRRAMQVK